MASYDSPDALHDLFLELPSLLSKGETPAKHGDLLIDPSSQMGLYIRKVLLTYHRMSFGAFCDLYDAVRRTSVPEVISSPPVHFSCRPLPCIKAGACTYTSTSP
jgi:hypothetical protein